MINHLPQEILNDLVGFKTGAYSMEYWKKWLAVHAAQLAKLIEREQFKRLKANPLEELQTMLPEDLDFEPPFQIRRDEIENDPSIGQLVEDTENRAFQEYEKQIADGTPVPGAQCRYIWDLQKKILKEEHGIDWKSPADLNEGMIFID